MIPYREARIKAEVVFINRFVYEYSPLLTNSWNPFQDNEVPIFNIT